MIIEALDVPWVVLLSMDSFYKVRSPPVHEALCLGAWSPCPAWSLWTYAPSAAQQVLTAQQQEQAAHNNFNFDHPDAFDFDLIVSTLKKLKQGKSVKVPIYDFTTHSRKKDWVGIAGMAPWLLGHRGRLSSSMFLCRRRCMEQMSSSSRASWPLLTRHCWR